MNTQDYLKMMAGGGGSPIAPPAPVMSQALRKKQALGELGAFSGDPVLAPLGGQLQDSAQSEAWRNSQQDMHQRGILTRALEAERDRAFDKSERELDRKNMLRIAGMRINGQDEPSLKEVMRYKRDLSKQYGAAGLPRLGSALDSIEATLSKNSKDIPGAGLTRLVPGFALSDEGKKVRQEFAELRNLLLQVRSGAAVTDAEFQRLGEEMGDWTGTSDEQMRQFVAATRKAFSEAQTHIYSGYDPFIVQLYETEQDYYRGQGGSEGEDSKAEGKYSVGQIIEHGGRRFRVTGGDPSDPDVELVE